MCSFSADPVAGKLVDWLLLESELQGAVRFDAFSDFLTATGFVDVLQNQQQIVD